MRQECFMDQKILFDHCVCIRNVGWKKPYWMMRARLPPKLLGEPVRRLL